MSDKVLHVTKRDGNIVPFNLCRIVNAVIKAFQATKEVAPDEMNDKAEIIANEVFEVITNSDSTNLHINEIQKLVEKILSRHFPETAIAYMDYRHERDIERDKNTALYKDIVGLTTMTNNDILNENANKDGKVIPTQRDLLAGIISKHYAKNHMLPRDIVLAHELGEIHYHDLDYSPFFPMFNCMIVDLENMLTNGFRMGNAEIETPKSIHTATAVTAQIVAQVASHTYGGTTLNRLDEILAPYVTCSYQKNIEIAREWNIDDVTGFARNRTEKEVYDAFQSLEYEINTLFSSNGQTPFLSVNFGLGLSWESRLIQKAILLNRIKGLGKSKKTAVFPKLLFTIRNGVNHKKGDPNYDIKQLALECASKRMYPDILNYDKVVEVTGSFKAPMGCRSFLGLYLDENGNEVHEGRNNLGVVSLNLPRIAIEAKGDESKFFEILDQRIQIVRKALETRIDRLRNIKAKVAPILYTEGALGVRLNPDDNVFEIFKNGRASISMGYIGIHEAINALYGQDEHIYDSEFLREKGIAIVKRLKEAVDTWKEETGFGYSLYSTPSENLCTRFCALDSKEFGVIEGVTDKGYYTNSFHLDVEKKVNPYDKIDFEMPYPELSSGGFICYGEFPNMQHNIEALENVWDYSYDRVPYYGTNTPIDECYECGFTGEFDCTSKGFVCPKCGNHDPKKVSVTRRVCGYLGSPDARPFNSGKQAEVIRRVKHYGNI
ncbi:anaerobic ribonucleoside-triphosphate reductase [Vibrio parahaemolyticus]|uniref:Ribonucleotide reductase of class III (Anaerobic), large subunit n=1 Tax=Vibrio vulnificus TaxID=672 RepID=A0AAN1PUL1_VIBVL|nr:anaerobic ribonucleoside-triphosphate reductase [Vibrio vulnificus]EGQ8892052.1 anaerobic ribonucleoside-triphosphate reductase [Vibrio parahaemolyticus]MCS0331036.1 anaerobic ribonucleoside-triphosphate reductase [Vibrio diabolicus]ARN69130.1 Ribonucleotide reductase of class III (anaerobic), large subunit [Vibrio vulnificus]AXX63105.1 Ribonucleotide reductase of class III (anaerobic), large subunit [Vibrio vulnificus]EGR3309512.1 anaerobic ribonucleoside-triphosphate reductase [Vibrio par